MMSQKLPSFQSVVNFAYLGAIDGIRPFLYSWGLILQPLIYTSNCPGTHMDKTALQAFSTWKILLAIKGFEVPLPIHVPRQEWTPVINYALSDCSINPFSSQTDTVKLYFVCSANLRLKNIVLLVRCHFVSGIYQAVVMVYIDLVCRLYMARRISTSRQSYFPRLSECNNSGFWGSVVS